MGVAVAVAVGVAVAAASAEVVEVVVIRPYLFSKLKQRKTREKIHKRYNSMRRYERPQVQPKS